MSRANKRAVIRGSLLLDMAERDLLSDRQKLAAYYLERDRQMATGTSAMVSRYEAPGGGSGASAPIARETFANVSWEALKRSLPPSYRRLLGNIELINATGKGTLAALPIRTGQAHERESGLVKRGMVQGFLEVVADHYRLPIEEA